MPRRFAVFLAILAVLAACKGGEDPQPSASGAAPSPTASASVRLSLLDALPSPTPNRSLPAMPPEAAGAFVFYEDFEKGIGKWETSGGTKTVGWHLLKAATCGGLFTMVLGEKGNPPTRFAAGDAYLTLKKPIDGLVKARRAQLQYDVKGETSPPDAAAIVAEVRAPGGAWKAIAPVATARFNLVVTFTADLAAYQGKPMELRFHGRTRPANKPSKGFYLDDIHVVEANPPTAGGV